MHVSKCAARGLLKIQDAKITENSPSGHHRTTLSGCIFPTKAYIENRKKYYTAISPLHLPHNMANFGPLTAEIGSGVWGIGANFNGFRALPSLLQRRRLPEANQTLHDVWPSPGLVHYIYTFRVSCPLTEVCPVQHSLYVQVLHSPILAALLHCTALQQRRQPNFVAW